MNGRLLIIIAILLEVVFLFYTTRLEEQQFILDGEEKIDSYSMITDSKNQRIERKTRDLKGSMTTFHSQCDSKLLENDSRKFTKFLLDEVYYIKNGELKSHVSKHSVLLVQDTLKNCIRQIELPQSYLTYFPSLLGAFPNLEGLVLNGNQLHNLEGLDDFKKLKYLDLSYNDILFIDDEILKLPNLETLDLTGNPNLDIITPNIRQLRKLKTLLVAFTRYHHSNSKMKRLKQLLPNTKIIVVEN
jgi:Leucine-rich repeat (LRR) protein